MSRSLVGLVPSLAWGGSNSSAAFWHLARLSHLIYPINQEVTGVDPQGTEPSGLLEYGLPHLSKKPYSLDTVQLSLYTEAVKKRDLERLLSEQGWYFLRSGSDHDIWTNGTDIEPVGRHRELPKEQPEKS